MEKLGRPHVLVDHALHGHAADLCEGLDPVLREVDEIKVVVVVDECVAVADDLDGDEDVDGEQDDEGDEQEEQPTQLFLVFHRRTTNIIIRRKDEGAFHPLSDKWLQRCVDALIMTSPKRTL